MQRRGKAELASRSPARRHAASRSGRLSKMRTLTSPRWRCGRAGYGSVDAFGRAFKEAFGLSPAIYRAQGSHAAFKAACVAGDAQAFPVEIVNLPEQRCAVTATLRTTARGFDKFGTASLGLYLRF